MRADLRANTGSSATTHNSAGQPAEHRAISLPLRHGATTYSHDGQAPKHPKPMSFPHKKSSLPIQSFPIRANFQAALYLPI
jgi:hypothetical protein